MSKEKLSAEERLDHYLWAHHSVKLSKESIKEIISICTEQLQRERDEWRLEYLTEKFNRSKRQTLELLELLGGDWDKLERLEVAIRKQFITGCPETLEEVKEILTPKPEK